MAATADVRLAVNKVEIFQQVSKLPKKRTHLYSVLTKIKRSYSVEVGYRICREISSYHDSKIFLFGTIAYQSNELRVYGEKSIKSRYD